MLKIYKKFIEKIKTVINIFFFLRDFFIFKKKNKKFQKRFDLSFKKIYPCLNDNTETTYFEPQYTYHPAWAARILKKNIPNKHIDISSTLNFCTIVSAFVPIDFYDYRPADFNLNNLVSKKVDLLSLPFQDNTIKSLSCMHTIEHIGLGRYGDKINPNGDIEAMEELKRVLDIEGNLLLVVPIGIPQIRFNAHRIYSYEQIVSLFDKFMIEEFALITDGGDFIINPDENLIKIQEKACGCFSFRKKVL